MARIFVLLAVVVGAYYHYTVTHLTTTTANAQRRISPSRRVVESQQKNNDNPYRGVTDMDELFSLLPGDSTGTAAEECMSILFCRVQMATIESGEAQRQEELKEQKEKEKKVRNPYSSTTSLYIYLHVLYDDERCSPFFGKAQQQRAARKDVDEMYKKLEKTTPKESTWRSSLDASNVTEKQCKYAKAWSNQLEGIDGAVSTKKNSDRYEGVEKSRSPYVYYRTCILDSEIPDNDQKSWRAASMRALNPPFTATEKTSLSSPSPPADFLQKFGNATKGTWFFYRLTASCRESSTRQYQEQAQWFFGRGSYIRRGGTGWFGDSTTDFKPLTGTSNCPKCVFLHSDTKEFNNNNDDLLYFWDWDESSTTRSKILSPTPVKPWRASNPSELGKVYAYKVGLRGGGQSTWNNKLGGGARSLSAPKDCTRDNCSSVGTVRTSGTPLGRSAVLSSTVRGRGEGRGASSSSVPGAQWSF